MMNYQDLFLKTIIKLVILGQEKENKFNAIELNDEDLLDVAGGFKKQSRLNLKSEQTKRCNKCSRIFSTAQGSTCQRGRLRHSSGRGRHRRFLCRFL